MLSLYLILLIIAAVCFFLAGINIVLPRVNLTALGLFFWVAAVIVGGGGSLHAR